MTCPLCGAAGDKPFVRKWKEFSLHDCPACGIGFCVPFKNPGAGFYHAFEDLYPHQAQTAPDPMSFEYAETLNSLRRDPAPGKRLLDVGCGGGGFLYVARQAGFDVAGIDFNEVRLKLIKKDLGIEKVFHGSIQDYAKTKPGKFDVVTMFQVLEHLDDPASWLAAIKELLAPGGKVFIGVPNRNRTFDQFRGPGMEELDNPPNHLTRWDAAALSKFVAKAGFEVLDTRALGVPRPLLALLLRNNLRFGLATKSLGVDELQHVKPSGAAGAPPSGKAAVVKALVGVKEALINGASCVGYPLFLAAKAALGWQGSVLLCRARRAG